MEGIIIHWAQAAKTGASNERGNPEGRCAKEESIKDGEKAGEIAPNFWH